MRKTLASLLLVLTIPAFSQVPTPELNKILTNAAQSLTAMRFDANAPVTIRGRVSMLVWPEGTSGIVILEASLGGEKFAFSTARVPQMAQQGFSRFTMKPGEEVIVTGVLAAGKATIGPGFSAARADLITKSDGNRVFDRSETALKRTPSWRTYWEHLNRQYCWPLARPKTELGEGILRPLDPQRSGAPAGSRGLGRSCLLYAGPAGTKGSDFVAVCAGDAQRSGLQRRYYSIEPEGIHALNNAKAVVDRVWEGVRWPLEEAL